MPQSQDINLDLIYYVLARCFGFFYAPTCKDNVCTSGLRKNFTIVPSQLLFSTRLYLAASPAATWSPIPVFAPVMMQFFPCRLIKSLLYCRPPKGKMCLECKASLYSLSASIRLRIRFRAKDLQMTGSPQISQRARKMFVSPGKVIKSRDFAK